VIVLDTSAAVALLLRRAPRLDEVLMEDGEGAAAPELLDVEVLSALRRAERRGDLDADRLAEAVEDLALAVPEVFPLRPLLPRMVRLRHGLSAYDAAYLALTELLDATLATADGRLAAAAERHTGVRAMLAAG
jgi:predicted nucleic acid-binding protein